MVAGIGCRAGASGEQVEAAIAAAIAALCAALVNREPAQGAERNVATDIGHAEHRRSTLAAIATPAAKIDEPGIQSAAALRGVPLLAISQEYLEAADPATVTHSARSMAAMNVQSVAEAAALAGAMALANGAVEPSPGAIAPTHSKPTSRLLQARVSVGPVTCALADTTTP